MTMKLLKYVLDLHPKNAFRYLQTLCSSDSFETYFNYVSSFQGTGCRHIITERKCNTVAVEHHEHHG